MSEPDSPESQSGAWKFALDLLKFYYERGLYDFLDKPPQTTTYTPPPESIDESIDEPIIPTIYLSTAETTDQSSVMISSSQGSSTDNTSSSAGGSSGVGTSVGTGQAPSIANFMPSGKRCPECGKKGTVVWVFPGRDCPYCYTYVS
ncbi:hypothetical protein F5Y11DRAFT_349582 [Daldinia sp. FL1419]|nr:hypothetical protein F5Y11DRAFT_349582 [Daldinia sp. FL1419]